MGDVLLTHPTKSPKRKKPLDEIRDVYAEYYKLRASEPEAEMGKELIERYRGKRGGSR